MALPNVFINNFEMDDSEISISKEALRLADKIQLAFAEFMHVHPNAYCLLMIDPSLRDAKDNADFSCVLKKYEVANSISSKNYLPILWRHRNLVPQHRPYLIPLNPIKFADAHLIQISAELALTDWSFESQANGLGHRICGWLFSEQPINKIVEQLGKAAVQRESSGKTVLLRFFDPSVMPHLWAISESAQKAYLPSGVSKWLMLTHTQNIQIFTSQQITSETAKAFNFNEREWQAVESISPLNQALTQWRNATRMQLSESQISGVRKALNRARNYGFHDSHDLTKFALCCLNIHLHFDKHPRIQTLLGQLAGAKYFSVAIESLESADWEKIKVDMQHPNLHTK